MSDRDPIPLHLQQLVAPLEHRVALWQTEANAAAQKLALALGYGWDDDGAGRGNRRVWREREAVTARKHTPLHDFWQPRVEGQIRHTMGRHPEWFAHIPARHQKDFVNSLAKRIVGEIVAASNVATMPGGVISTCAAPVPCGGCFQDDAAQPGRDVTCAPADRGADA